MRWLIVLVMFLSSFCIFSGGNNDATIGEGEDAIVQEEKIIIEEFVEPELGYGLFYRDFEASDVRQVINVMTRNLVYEPGSRFSDPQTIFKRGTATVNELTIMFINIVKVNFDLEVDLAIVDTREIMRGSGLRQKYQAMPSYEGVVYNLFNIKKYFPLEPLYFYEFEEVFNTLKLPIIPFPDYSNS